jgi:hypothetical protein
LNKRHVGGERLDKETGRKREVGQETGMRREVG